MRNQGSQGQDESDTSPGNMESQRAEGKVERRGACAMTEVEGRENDMILPLTVKCRSLFVRPVWTRTDKNSYDSYASQNSEQTERHCVSIPNVDIIV